MNAHGIVFDSHIQRKATIYANAVNAFGSDIKERGEKANAGASFIGTAKPIHTFLFIC